MCKNVNITKLNIQNLNKLQRQQKSSEISINAILGVFNVTFYFKINNNGEKIEIFV